MIYNLGRVVPIFKGDYNSATTYNFLDVVYYDNSSFVALDTTTGNLPTDTEHWLPVALKGTTQDPTPAQMQEIISAVETYMEQTDFVQDPDYTHIDVVDNHTSTSTTNALAANQGKVLYELIDDNSHSISDLENNVERLDNEALKGISTNLFDKTKIIEGYYVHSLGHLTQTPNGVISNLIPIEPNTTYAYSIIGASGSDLYFRFVASDGTTQLKPLNPTTNEEINYSLTSPSKLLKSPSNAAYAQFTVKLRNNDRRDYIQLVKTDTLPTVYYPYQLKLDYNQLPTQLTEELSDINTSLTDKIGRTEYEGDLADIETELDTKAEYTTIHSRNLINPDEVQVGKYISYGTALNVNQPANSSRTDVACSGLIPVIPGTTYYLTRGYFSSDAAFCFIKENGTSSTIPLDPLTDEPLELAQLKNKSRAYKAPSDAKYALICLMYSGWTSDKIDGFQFEEGSTPTEHEPYWVRDVITINHLPKEVEDTVEETVPDLVERVETLEENSSIDIINVGNSDKIGFFSNSFLSSGGMKNHHSLNKLALFTDYIIYNFGHSGDDMLELLARIDANQTWFGTIPVRNWGIKYGIIAMQDNDSALYAANADTYYQNSKKLADAIKSMGGIPILSTEHDWNKYYYAFNRLSDEEGYMFMNWGMKANEFSKNQFTQFWASGHPSTRTNWLWTYGMKPYIDTLPRPKKSIKLFRVRNSSLDLTDASNLQGLVYNNYLERGERFIELKCGCKGLTTATNKYFDRLNLGLHQNENVNDEYQKIQAGSAVSFGNGALIEVITPYDRNNLKYFKTDITSTGSISHAYCKKVNGLTNPLPSRRYYSFGILEGANLLTVGSTITISGIAREDGTDLNTTYTIGGIVNDMLITTTTSSPAQAGWTNGKTSGTDNPTCNISGVVLKGSYDYPDAAYMERYNKPLGEWTEVVINNGSIELTQQNIKEYTDFDKISILLVGTDISISDIQTTVSGIVVKNDYTKKLVEAKNGTSLLTNTTFTSSDTAWNGISDLADYTPITDVNDLHPEVLPMGFTNVKEMELGDTVSQTINTTGLNTTNQLTPTKLQLKVIARYFPKYIKTDADWLETEVDENSFDIAKLKVYIHSSSDASNPTPVAEIPIGAWWNEFVVDLDYSQGNILKLECTSKHIHIAKCDLIKVN